MECSQQEQSVNLRFGIFDNFYSDTDKKMSLNTKYYFNL